ncbi:glycosyltransferase family 2 protein [Anabaena azotica]|uniref:Glycosyltransferase family 2 protein n=1 Tax=Anabaena azotica FACHB-119 TaxID=947527 RepID=A0ABR8D5D9_9NOST|nr:glycosyltransferase family A protein [Anabaena azotica]MBD2501919.1 glycosyltransferase family 2 protein [Anabaena azotica FACHB-119]
MRFSLIMATLNRDKEISRFLAKLDNQTHQDFELIVVDQNSDNRVLEVLEPYQKHLIIRHIRSSIPGASRSRNLGLREAKGEIIGFPDDDCWYPEDLLARVNSYFENNPQWDVVSGSSAGESYWDRQPGMVTKFNVWKRGIEYSVFFRRDLVLKIGDLDESLGPGSGSRCWAGEITDYMLRALKVGCDMYYDPNLAVHHPGVIQTNQNNNFNVIKSYHYAIGKGRVLRKSNTPLWFVAYQCIKPLGQSILGLIQQRPEQQQLCWAVFQGIVQGWKEQV